jgi:outer membrane usher protein
MSTRPPAGSLHRLTRLAAFLAALLTGFGGPTLAADGGAGARGNVAEDNRGSAPFETLISRVVVNSMPKGDLPIVRDGKGHLLVPASEFSQWRLGVQGVDAVDVRGEAYVDVTSLPGVVATFDAVTVTLELQVAAQAFPATRLDLAPRRRPDVVFPTDSSVFLNYALNASGDDGFDQRRYQFTTELGARLGDWLLYNTTNQVWGDGGPANGFTRLVTNAQYDDRPNLRRLTLGDFFTPSLDLSGAVPLGGVSLAKTYSMDPYYVQYPSASFRTEVALPSTVSVRVDGNVIDQRQVQPGPLDIANIVGTTGTRNVSVVIRDAFGREQVLQQPFFFATNAGLAEGLHDYAYNLGFLRRQYGIESDDYGGLAASAFHRYAFTNALTLGLLGQAASDLYNVGAFGTYQFPRLGLLAAGASIGGGNGQSGPAGSLAYAYTGGNVSLGLGARQLSRDYAQLSDLASGFRTQSDRYASASFFGETLGSVSATYTSTTRYDGPETRVWNAGYTRSALDGKGLLSLSYTRTIEPSSTSAWLLSFRYYFDAQTSLAAGVGGVGNRRTQSVSLDRAVPQGEGIGYSFTAAHLGGNGASAGYGRAFVQLNAERIALGADYSRSSEPDASPSFSQFFVAGSIGAVGGSLFMARPVLDSFALVRIPGMPGIPVYANGWFAGKTDDRGEVVATNLASYYDNYITFGAADLPIDYVFDQSERVISPPTRSGTLVTFAIRRNRAVQGALFLARDGTPVALEFRDIRLTGAGQTISGFTARRGEFYVEGLEPGEYQLRTYGEPQCVARIVVPEQSGPTTDVGVVTCELVR